MKTWQLATVLMVPVVLGPVYACSSVAPPVAKAQYELDLQGCLDHNHDRATIDTCFAAVRAAWDDAGARPAAILDGGAQ